MPDQFSKCTLKSMALTEVQHTLFFPLLGRAAAAHRWPKLFPDPWAEQAAEIVAQEGTPAKHIGDFPELVYGIRHRLMIDEIKTYLRTHPGAAVVNLGCGLDQLEPDLADTNHGTIYNLDFPEVIEMRNRWVPPGASVDLAYSATDHRWLEQVDAENGVITIAAGVMYYLTVSDAAELIDAMAQAFPRGRFVYDAESPTTTRMSERKIAKAGQVAAIMPFKVKDPFSAQYWSRSINDISICFNFLDYLPASERKQLPRSLRFGMKAFEIIKGMYIVRLNFKP